MQAIHGYYHPLHDDRAIKYPEINYGHPRDAEYSGSNGRGPSSDQADGPESGSKAKKRKTADGEKVKKTRQSQSCDACRARKVRCDRPPPGATNVDPSLPTKDICSNCRNLGLSCTFEYKPKKRGPPNQYLRRLEEEGQRAESSEAAKSISSQQTPKSEDDLCLSPFARHAYPPNPAKQETSSPYITTSSYFRSGLPLEQGGPGPGTLAEQRASHATSLVKAGSYVHASNLASQDIEAAWPTANMLLAMHTSRSGSTDRLVPPTPTESAPPVSFSRVSDMSGFVSPSLDTMSTSAPASNGRAGSRTGATSRSPYSDIPNDPNNPFDAILPRRQLFTIIDLYFDYVYGLVPIVHRPSFMRDLYGRKEETPDSGDWIALVMTLVGFTLMHVPKPFLHVSQVEAEEIINKTQDITNDYLARRGRPMTVLRRTDQLMPDVILYMAMTTSVLTGDYARSCDCKGSNWANMIFTRGIEERTYVELPPIERELRRRVLWLMVGADKSWAMLDNMPPFACDSTYHTVELPSQLEDEWITETEFLQPDPGASSKTSILSGFYYISKLFQIAGKFLDKRHFDRANSPTGQRLVTRVRELSELYDQVQSLMDDCPLELKLEHGSIMDLSPTDPTIDEWDVQAADQLRELFSDPKANGHVSKDAYLVQQANIYVTQQMVRYLILQHRDLLVSLYHEEIGASTSQLTCKDRWEGMCRVSDEEKEEVAADLLAILHKIPIQVIAVNNIWLVDKVRVVASMLLDALNASCPPSPAEDPTGRPASMTSVQRAQNYLWSFLHVLSEIETICGAPNGASTLIRAS